ncbi:MAG: peptidoglycan-binding domain-containing protein [Microbacteriaceae bacterium]
MTVSTVAALRLFTPPAVSADDTTALVTLSSGSVSSSLTLNVAASWPSTVAGANLATGVVTSVGVTAGQRVTSGEVLFTVDMRPVVIAEGRIPAYTDLSIGDSGRIVAQLQRLLIATGDYSGPVSGVFDAAVRSAVEAWQSGLGLDADGLVRSADIIYVPELPARVVLDSSVLARGMSLSGGEQIVSTLASSPVFSITATAEQAAQIAVGSAVSITAPDGTQWSAVTGEQSQDADSPDIVTIEILPADGAARVCGKHCDLIPAGEQSLLASEVVLVPSTSGLVVPSAALVSDEEGETGLRDEDGVFHEVTVQASAQGMSVVSGAGLAEGQLYEVASDG